MELLVPLADPPKSRASLASRLAGLEGHTVGLIDNGWWCLDVIYDEIETLLAERYGVVGFLRKPKHTSSPTAQEDLQELVQKCGAVITGLGN
jgi:hypothetical protein